MSLKNRTITGLYWAFGQQFGLQAVNFIVSIILARLLMPEDFGLIGMLSIFISIGAILTDSGLSSSLLRSDNLDQRDYSTVFFISLIGSSIMYLTIFFCAPYIAAFYELAILKNIIRVYSLTFVINAFADVQRTRLTRNMNFKLQTKIQIPSIFIGGLLGVSLAYYGFGVWSLVYMYLFQSTIATIQLWSRSKWHPNLVFDMKKFKHHFSFGYKLTLTNLLEAIYNNAFNLIIGKFFSAAQLGYYTRARTLKNMPVQNISTVLYKVTYPMFSSIQGDNVKLKNTYRRVLQQVIFWLAPVMIFLIIVAEPLLVLLLGDKWLPAVPYFQILCGTGIMIPLNSFNINILNVKGRSDLVLKLSMINKIIITVGIACVFSFGIYALLYFQLVFSVFTFLINSSYSGKMINYSVSEQLKDVAPEIILSLIVGLIGWMLDYYFLLGTISNDIVRIALVGVTFSILYFGLSWIAKIPAIGDFKQLVMDKKSIL